MKNKLICILLILVLISIERNIYQGKRIVFLSRPYDLIVDIKDELDKKLIQMIEIIESQELERSKHRFDSLHALLEIRKQCGYRNNDSISLGGNE